MASVINSEVKLDGWSGGRSTVVVGDWRCSTAGLSIVPRKLYRKMEDSVCCVFIKDGPGLRGELVSACFEFVWSQRLGRETVMEDVFRNA